MSIILLSSALVRQCRVPVPLMGALPTPFKLPSDFSRCMKSDLCGDAVRFATIIEEDVECVSVEVGHMTVFMFCCVDGVDTRRDFG